MPKISTFGIPLGYMTVAQFAKKTKFSTEAVRKWIKIGTIESTYSSNGVIAKDGPGTIVIHIDELRKIK